MKRIATDLPDVWILEPVCHRDARGWFMESYNRQTLLGLGIDCDFVQDNHSYSRQAGTLRGLHFQNPPFAQTKLVRCSSGRILDVAVDIRRASPTYRQWVAVELSAENQRQLLIPRGFAHGFLTLVDDVEVQYKTDAVYDRASDRSIRYDDPAIGIRWGDIRPILSDKDREAPCLAACDHLFD